MPKIHEEQCELFISQEIEAGLERGQTPYKIGKEIAVWVEKLFGRTVKANTITKRVHRISDNVTNHLRPENSCEIEENQVTHGGTRECAGRKPKYLMPRFTVCESNYRAQGTGENEWYTPPEYVARVRRVLGRIDLDPATSVEAQKTIRADAFYTKVENGLSKPWQGKVWLNPPYSQPEIGQFVTKLVSELGAGNTTEAIMLTHNYTDSLWFHLAESKCSAICFTRGRIRFERSDGSVACPTQGQCFFYFGQNTEKFRKVFKDVGFIR